MFYLKKDYFIYAGLFLLGLLIGGAAFAQELRIGAGQPGRGYDSYAKSLSTRLHSARIETSIRNYAGSYEIATALCNQEADLGPMQIDAIFAKSQQGCNLDVVGVYGEEYAMIFFPPDSKKSSLSDLGAGDAILVDEIGSGSELFVQTILSIENGPNGNKSNWSKARLVNGSFDTADAQARIGAVSAVILVNTPTSQLVKDFIQKGWSMGDLYDKDIDDQLFNGQPLYRRESIDLNLRGFFQGGDSGDAYLVSSLIAASPQWRTRFNENSRVILAEVNKLR